MKRIYNIILLLVLFVTTIHAQKNIYIWKESGNLTVKSVTKIDSLTFGDVPFNVLTSTATDVTMNSLHATANVSFISNIVSMSQNPEVGVCFSTINSNPTCADEHIRIGSSAGIYDFILYDLDPGTTYYYRAYAKLGGIFYGNVVSVVTSGAKPIEPNYTIINGHKFIDLGLPSGLLWACTNVGATFSSDDGIYLAWGETETKNKSYYMYSTYKYGDPKNASKYNSLDGKKYLDPQDDVATVLWGTGCRIPSVLDFEEIKRNCKWTWRSNYQGKSGYFVSGPNGNFIFLPASGFRDADELLCYGSAGSYWTNSLASYGYSSANVFYWGSSSVNPIGSSFRYDGHSVRPVAEKR